MKQWIGISMLGVLVLAMAVALLAFVPWQLLLVIVLLLAWVCVACWLIG